MACAAVDVRCAATEIGWAAAAGADFGWAASAGANFGWSVADGAEFSYLAAPSPVALICFQAAGWAAASAKHPFADAEHE